MSKNIKTNHANLEVLLNSIPDRVFVIDEDGVFLDAFGGVDTGVIYTSDKLIGKSFADLFPPNVAGEFKSVVTLALTANETQIYTYNFAPENFPKLPDAIAPTSTQWYESRVHPLPELYKEKKAVIWVGRNVTESQELKQRLMKLSQIDDLSGVLNRRSFLESMERCWGQKTRFGLSFSLVMVDIDNFKSINDTYGHQCGDKVICTVAQLLKEQLRKIDYIGRVGGEEFAILLTNTSARSALEMAKRACRIIEEHDFEIADFPHQVTISAGVCGSCVAQYQVEDLFCRADQALYQAKSEGKNRAMLYRRK